MKTISTFVNLCPSEAKDGSRRTGIASAGGATAADFLALRKLVQEKVLADSGVMLEPEVRIVGEDP